jgi:sugar phosphate isomerase/epimerase
MTEQDLGITFGVDLITFYHPEFWGVLDHADLVQQATREPVKFWNRVLDSVKEAGITGLELTFPPGDWRSAVTAYGSAQGFAHALSARGLKLVSGFFTELAMTTGPVPGAEQQEKMLQEAAEYADFIRAAGGDLMVAGLPMRRGPDADPPFFVDLHAAEPLADLLNRLGDLTLRRGVRLALHTEAHSVFCTGRDVDLFMTLTDPVYVGMCPDTGHMVLAGSDPVHVMNRHRERLALAHWKDCIGAGPKHEPIDENIHQSHRKYFRRVGTGTVDWFSWARLLREIRYRGCTLLELDAAPDPVTEMRAARGFVETALAPLYA